jgi:hypothetical protein
MARLPNWAFLTKKHISSVNKLDERAQKPELALKACKRARSKLTHYCFAFFQTKINQRLQNFRLLYLRMIPSKIDIKLKVF